LKSSISRKAKRSGIAVKPKHPEKPYPISRKPESFSRQAPPSDKKLKPLFLSGFLF